MRIQEFSPRDRPVGRAGVRAGAGRPCAHRPAAPAADPATGKPAVLTSTGRLPVCNGLQEVPPPSTRRQSASSCRLPAPVRLSITWRCVLPEAGERCRSIDAQTYLYYMQSPDLLSLPSQNVWKPYNEAAEQTIIGDHKRLWATNFLDDLKIEAVDFPVLERRHRQSHRLRAWKSGSGSRTPSTTKGRKTSSKSKVEERLRELGITIRLDSFVDQATEKKVANVIREMMVEKGFQEAKVEPYHEAASGRTEDGRAEIQDHRRAENQDFESRFRRQ